MHLSALVSRPARRNGMPRGLGSLSPASRAAVASMLRDGLTQHGGISIEATGRSMEPTIPGGSLLELEPLPARVAVGDLLVFVHHSGAHLCCHRIVEVTSGGAAMTRGDGSIVHDGWTQPELWVGVVRCFLVGGRRFVDRGAPDAVRPSHYRRVRQRLSGWARRRRVGPHERVC